ncbi:MAG: NAD(P)/FAD-dependent oxidoreductase [Deltaproteobacteria bacterium]|nr:NAD(P)/FAD-dependent oxidoreductase [Deltaproteobacteria bacterium]
MTRHVIIGNGIAGLSAAETIRQLDPTASITIIAAEKILPYSRPMISLVLDGSIPAGHIGIRSSDYYRDFGLEPLIGHRVVDMDLEGRTVRTDDDQIVEYDRLLIATGADPRPMGVEGVDMAGIHYMRTETQVQTMVEELPLVKTALVLGGGLVGFKAAYGLLKRGLKVTMLISSAHPLSMQVDDVAGRLILEELISHGLTVKVKTDVRAFEGGSRVEAAVMTDGSRAACDLVVIGKGVNPALEFIPRRRISVNQGVIVDRHLRTTEPDIYAAGDVAEANDLVRGRPWINAIWPVAAEQGRLAGMNMAGRPVAYDGSLGRNVIRVFGLDVMTAGLVNPPQNQGYQAVAQLDHRRRTYRKLIFKDDLLVGLVLVGKIEQGGVLISLIQSRRPVTFDQESLLDDNFNYGRLIG